MILLLVFTGSAFAFTTEYTLEWSAIGTSTVNQQPTTDTEIYTANAKNIFIHFNTRDVNNVSTDIDLNILASPDCRNYDDGVNYIYASENDIVDAREGVFALTPGMKCIKLRIDNDDGANAASIIVTVIVTK